MALLLSSCSCSSGEVVGGPTPYVRCAAREPAVIDRAIGAVRVRSEERTLTIEGAAMPLRIAVFRGPVLADEPFAPALDAIEAAQPGIAVLLGSLGEDGRVDALIASLAELPIPTLVVLGGRDHPEDLEHAIAAVPETAAGIVIDASPFRSVRVSGIELVPVAGAPDGRYARDDEACGLNAADVDAIVGALDEPSVPRFLIGFAAPSPLPGIEGGEAGSALVADLGARTSARGGLFAWPDVPTARPTTPTLDVRLVVPPPLGPPAFLSDGSRASSGPLVVEVSPEGVRALAVP
jgi:hypothetical protein